LRRSVKAEWTRYGKARDTRLDRIVAMKFSQEKFSERFEREAKAISSDVLDSA
jgi:hypothetical protein